ncbi:hypothetical protein H8356DRAFT_959014 [Neocallimastix lanati (nom. inval.)]|nr:hypothetical protein H8356DRAFT_959014 [Neocallimastix sp. JGI-2020a]
MQRFISFLKLIKNSTYHLLNFQLIRTFQQSNNNNIDYKRCNLSGNKVNSLLNIFYKYDLGYYKTNSYVDITRVFTSNGTGGIIYNGTPEDNRIPYYDLDLKYIKLIEHGWCNFTTNNEDTEWISGLSNDILINQINIPGTHDNEVYVNMQVKLELMYLVFKILMVAFRK